MDTSLFHLDLSSKVLNELRNGKFTTIGSVLSKSGDLRHCLKLELTEVDHLLHVISCEALRRQPPITGGIPQQGITEIAGESASGKTQLSLQLSLTVQKPVTEGGLNGAVLYVCTEDTFPIKRLQQLIGQIDDTSGNLVKKAYSDRVFVEHVEDADGLIQVLQRKLPLLINQRSVKLLIIDSIAAVFRSQYKSEEAIKRAQMLNLVGSILHCLNEQHNIFIICINQVTDVIEESSSDAVGRSCAPSLGLTWSNIVNTRIILARTNEFYQRSLGFPGSEKSIRFDVIKRKLTINFSPFLPPSCCYFVVNSSGVHGL